MLDFCDDIGKEIAAGDDRWIVPRFAAWREGGVLGTLMAARKWALRIKEIPDNKKMLDIKNSGLQGLLVKTYINKNNRKEFCLRPSLPGQRIWLPKLRTPIT